MSFQEEGKLLEQMGDYAPHVQFAILTGLRKQEQFRLEWSHVDLERGLLTLPVTKAWEVQYVPLEEHSLSLGYLAISPLGFPVPESG